MAATIDIHEAKTNLSALGARAEAGRDIVIARAKRPVVRGWIIKAPVCLGARASGPRAGGTPALPEYFTDELDLVLLSRDAILSEYGIRRLW